MRFRRPWGWGGVVRRAGAVFPTSGVVGQPTRGWGCRWPPRPLGVAVVLGSVARTPEGAAVAAASVRLRRAGRAWSLELAKPTATWHSKTHAIAICPCTSACDALLQAQTAARLAGLHSIRAAQAPHSLCLQHTTRSASSAHRSTSSHDAATVYAATSSARLSRPRRDGAGPARRLRRRRRLRRAAAAAHGAGPRRAAGHRPGSGRWRLGRQARLFNDRRRSCQGF